MAMWNGSCKWDEQYSVTAYNSFTIFVEYFCMQSIHSIQFEWLLPMIAAILLGGCGMHQLFSLVNNPQHDFPFLEATNTSTCISHTISFLKISSCLTNIFFQHSSQACIHRLTIITRRGHYDWTHRTLRPRLGIKIRISIPKVDPQWWP